MTIYINDETIKNTAKDAPDLSGRLRARIALVRDAIAKRRAVTGLDAGNRRAFRDGISELERDRLKAQTGLMMHHGF